MFCGIEWFMVLYNLWWTKSYFGILRNLYVRSNVALSFSEEQKFQFLLYLLPSVCLVHEIVLQIKNYKTKVVMSCLSFLAYQTHLYYWQLRELTTWLFSLKKIRFDSYNYSFEKQFSRHKRKMKYIDTNLKVSLIANPESLSHGKTLDTIEGQIS